MEEIKQKLLDLNSRFKQISIQIDRDQIRKEIRELETQTMKEGFGLTKSLPNQLLNNCLKGKKS
jgi:hypothetical protein